MPEHLPDAVTFVRVAGSSDDGRGLADADVLRGALVVRALSLSARGVLLERVRPPRQGPNGAPLLRTLAALLRSPSVSIESAPALFCASEQRRVDRRPRPTSPRRRPDAWLTVPLAAAGDALRAIESERFVLVLPLRAPWTLATDDALCLAPDTTFVAYDAPRPAACTWLVPHFELNRFLADAAPDELAVADLSRRTTAKLRDPSRLRAYVDASQLRGALVIHPLGRTGATLPIATDRAAVSQVRHARLGRIDRGGRLRRLTRAAGGPGLEGCTFDEADRRVLDHLDANGMLAGDPLATRLVPEPTCPACGGDVVRRLAPRVRAVTTGSVETIAPVARAGDVPFPAFRCTSCDEETVDPSALDALAEAREAGRDPDWYDPIDHTIDAPSSPCPRCGHHAWQRVAESIAPEDLRALALARPALDGARRVIVVSDRDRPARIAALAAALAPGQEPAPVVALAAPPPAFPIRDHDDASRLVLACAPGRRAVPAEVANAHARSLARRTHRQLARLRELASDAGAPVAPWTDLGDWLRVSVARLQADALGAISMLDVPRLLSQLRRFGQRTLAPLTRFARPGDLDPALARDVLARLEALWSPFLSDLPGPPVPPLDGPATTTGSIDLTRHFDQIASLRRRIARLGPATTIEIPSEFGNFLRRAGAPAAPWLGLGRFEVETGPNGPSTLLRRPRAH